MIFKGGDKVLPTWCDPKKDRPGIIINIEGKEPNLIYWVESSSGNAIAEYSGDELQLVKHSQGQL